MIGVFVPTSQVAGGRRVVRALMARDRRWALVAIVHREVRDPTGRGEGHLSRGHVPRGHVPRVVETERKRGHVPKAGDLVAVPVPGVVPVPVLDGPMGLDRVATTGAGREGGGAAGTSLPFPMLPLLSLP